MSLGRQVPWNWPISGLCRHRVCHRWGFQGHTKLPRSIPLLQNRVASFPEGRVCGVSNAIHGLTRATEGERGLEIMIVRQNPSPIKIGGPNGF